MRSAEERLRRRRRVPADTDQTSHQRFPGLGEKKPPLLHVEQYLT